MPIYEYKADDGSVELIRRPVDLRDAPVLLDGKRYRRCTVPSRLTVGVGTRPPTMGDRLAKGYKKLEEQGGLRDNPNYLPAKTIKAAFEVPDVHQTPAEKAAELAQR